MGTSVLSRALKSRTSPARPSIVTMRRVVRPQEHAILEDMHTVVSGTFEGEHAARLCCGIRVERLDSPRLLNAATHVGCALFGGNSTVRGFDVESVRQWT